MKSFFKVALLVVTMLCMLFTVACNPNDVQEIIDNNTKTLDVPTNVRVDENSATLMWNSVEYASGYTIMVNQTTYTSNTNSFSLQGLRSGEYTISVMANGDGVKYISSSYSNTIKYTRDSSSGNEYADDVVAAFREFDEINTKNSFLGYGIDIINASAIASKNVLVTYPIFDIDKLMNEKLLKSNEHYNSFESIEARTIEEFCQNMSNSASITAGANVSAKGNIVGADVSASASLTSGLTAGFTKTSSSVESQYFLEIIAENQSYWLILQTSEARYKDILSEEFKADLYNKSITAAQLFEKYGTHLLTSVAMGGNICMYYTMYSYNKGDFSSKYAEVSSTLKTNVEAAYGGASAGIGTENSFENTFTYQSLAQSYGIHVDKKIVSAGGGSFGINNEATLYENYQDWQKSLDTYPVVIGIKDTNSLYPIWNLLDLNIEGAAERYTELYDYFQKYGKDSYNNLCETYAITPSVAPTDITNITVGTHKNYTENQIINVRAGETFQVAFDVLPDNATKYVKTFSVDNSLLATIDDTGFLTISPNAAGGSYIKVTITAGAVSKQITLYVINTYNVNFNTRVTGLNVAPIYGILEGYMIDAPYVEREGYILEGWYTDIANTKKFNFDKDNVISHMTLYANWVAIKPAVTFDTGDGSIVDTQILAYNGTVTKPKNPTLSGYTFGGWYVDEDYTETFDFATTVIEDITLYAKWNIMEFTISFSTDGGTPVADVTTSILEGYKIAEPITTKQYYTLDGWYKDAYFTQKFYFETEITSDITLYAKWTPAKATVNFVDTDGVSSVYDEFGYVINARTTDIDKSFKITVPTPVKEGYTFVGWYLDGIAVDLAAYADFKPQTEAYTLVAKWSVNTYSIKFIIDGEEYSTERYTFGEEIIYPEVTVEGHTFSGWKYGYKALPETMPAENISITGTLTINNYTVTYYVDGNLYSTKTYAYGANITLIAEPTVDGKEFSGWVCSSMDKMPTTMPAFDIRIDGSFDQSTYYIRYYIDDVLVKTSAVIKGHVISAYIPDDKEGFSFSGWQVKDGEQSSIIPETMPAKDISAYGTYTINQYTITFVSDGDIIATITKDYGEAIIKPADPIKTGYTFAEWDKAIPETMPAKDMTITAKWTVNKYTITFNTDGGSTIAAITKDYGASITKPADPTKTGCTFAEWDKIIPETMPAEDMTITAKWTVNQYTITFNTDGGNTIAAITKDFGASITKPADPTKTGYKFAGWDKTIPETMPAENMTITAKWELYTSNISYIINSTKTVDEQNTKGNFEKSSIGIVSVSYKVTQLETARATTYGSYYKFVGWCLTETYSESNMLTDSNGTLLPNVAGYTDANRRWIHESFNGITLYAQWKQEYSNYTYIETLDDFKKIKDNPSGRYMLLADIPSMGNVPMIESFSGVLDGRGHKLSGWRYSHTTATGSVGLFRTIAASGVVQNIIIDDFVLKSNTSYNPTGTLSAGLLCGTLYGELQTVVVQNSEIYADMGGLENSCKCNSATNVGALVGLSSGGKIYNCGSIKNSVKGYAGTKMNDGESHCAVGGIVGKANGATKMEDCYSSNNTVNALAEYYDGFPSTEGLACASAGGLIGNTDGSQIEIRRCIAYGMSPNDNNKLITVIARDDEGDSDGQTRAYRGYIIGHIEGTVSANECYGASGYQVIGGIGGSGTSSYSGMIRKTGSDIIKLSSLPDTFENWAEDKDGNLYNTYFAPVR